MEIALKAKALETHNNAQNFFSIAEQYAYKFLMELKTLRDEKLYKQLDCKDFSDYCSTYFNASSDFLNERIKIASEFGEPSFNEKYQKIGHSKSLLIARSANPSVYLDSEGIEEITVKALKAKIKAEVEAEVALKQNVEAIKKEMDILHKSIVEMLVRVCHMSSITHVKNAKIFHLAYERYVKPNDEATEAQRKRDLIRLGSWHLNKNMKEQEQNVS